MRIRKSQLRTLIEEVMVEANIDKLLFGPKGFDGLTVALTKNIDDLRKEKHIDPSTARAMVKLVEKIGQLRGKSVRDKKEL